MSKIALTPNASGTGVFTIAAPNSNTDRTLTLPDVTGTVLTDASTVIKQAGVPAFSVRNNATQSLSNNTEFKVAFQVKEYDTANCFDSTTNYRFTPTVAGYYQLNASVKIENNGANGTLLCNLFKNGTYYKESQVTVRAGSNTSAECCSLVYFNGSTDYAEIIVLQSTGATATLVTNGTLATWFNGCLVRGA